MEEETLELTNGNKVHFKRQPRYGLWSVNFDKGGIPSELKGGWQSLPDLKKKVDNYLQRRPTRNRASIKKDDENG